MKAAVYARAEPQGVAVRSNHPLPRSAGAAASKPARGHALVRVVVAGTNPVDKKAQVGDKFAERWEPLLRWGMEGRGVGFDFAGVVEAMGDGAHGHDHEVRVGDAVFGTVPPVSAAGSMSEFVEVPTHQLARKPASLSFAEAAALPLVGLTSLQSLRDDYRLRPGQRLLLLGASGGVGHVAIQVAKCLGAHVVAVCSKRNVELVTRLGADEVVDYTAGDVIAALHHVVGSAKGKGFNLVLDCVSSHDERDQAAMDYEHAVRRAQPSLLESGAMYVTIGGRTHEWAVAGLKRTVGVNLFPLLGAGKELFWVRFPHATQSLETLAAWADEGRLRPLVSREVEFTDKGVQSAFAELHSRRAVGKCVVRVAPDPVAGAGAATTTTTTASKL